MARVAVAETADPAAVARRGLERVCTGREPATAPEVYREDFVDHVNALEFRGLEGVSRSVALYRTLLPDVSITVEDQVADGDLVASRWTMSGHSGKRRVTLGGITISRIRDGRIAEDWTSSDNLDLVRQLGVRRSAAAALKMLRWRLGR
jgi:predicted ester cyclase